MLCMPHVVFLRYIRFSLQKYKKIMQTATYSIIKTDSDVLQLKQDIRIFGNAYTISTFNLIDNIDELY